MSSVQRFIRQITVSSTYHNAASVVANPATYAYEMSAAGTMATAGATMQAAISTAAAAAANLVLRDMGKTVRAPLASNGGNGFFRQVQLLAPTAITSYMGGVGANSFGVRGEIATNFITFYIPIVALGASSDMAHVSTYVPCGQQ
jgi:hypothetical protein